MRKFMGLLCVTAGLALIIGGALLSLHHKDLLQQAAPITAPLPDNLKYQGQPIDPACFNDFTRDAVRFTKTIKLADCAKLDKDSVFDGSIQERDNGELFRELKCGDDCFGAAYIGYRYIGPWQGNELVEINNAEGGASQYTSLSLIKRHDDGLQIVKDIAAGDRCNSGITDATINNGHLIYTQYATPNSLIAAAKAPDVNIDALNLSDDAVNCVAEIHFTDGKITGASLTQASEDIQSISEDATDETQACFNQLYVARLDAKQKELTPAALTDFGQEFMRNCAASIDDHAVAD